MPTPKQTGGKAVNNPQPTAQLSNTRYLPPQSFIYPKSPPPSPSSLKTRTRARTTMQNLHPTPSLSGRIFPKPNTPTQTHQPAIKCPRCNSPNTKFCYYNNYNLAQPRHFCKSCRRYWTKGGVLRNVPVGGGCRKNSKTRNSKPKPDKQPPKPSTPGSGSSSETAVSFTGLLAGAEGFGLSDSGLEPKAVEEKAGRNDLDWVSGSVDPGSLFDVTGSADPAVYWNVNHWVDTDPSLYLP